MDELKNIVKQDIYQTLIEGSVDSLPIIINKSVNELHDLTHLPIELLETIKSQASDIVFKKKFVTAAEVPPWERISTGCENIDTVLRGGIPVNGVTEIYGCSGVGKTQICLQLALMVQLPKQFSGKEKGVVYVCTEDVFPSKRFHQLANTFKDKYNLQDFDFESNVYLDHAADFEQLRRCLSVRLPQLLHSKSIGLLVIDSIAGIFRSENNDVCYTSRGQEITNIALALHWICNKYKISIVCVNQVTENLISGNTEPCLGLAWANNVTSRLCITRYNNSAVRELDVIFTPDLPNSNCSFTISENGVVGAC